MAIGKLAIENYVAAIRQNEGLYTKYDITTDGVLVASTLPAVPSTGTKVLTATNGVVTWEDAA